MSGGKRSSAKSFDAEIESLGWSVGRMLGEGAFGKVKLVTRQSDGQTAACKIIAKPKDLKKLKVIEVEYTIMQNMEHPYIVKCFEVKETEQHVFLFLELMEGGELFDKIVELGHLTESKAAQLTYNMLTALNYMHGRGIIHRDLKPENLLLAQKDGDFCNVKLTDFGLSKMLDAESSIMKTPVGTPGYVAPEVLEANKNGGYDHKVDVWSTGVIVYILLCGFPPFYADNDAQLFQKIKKGDYQFIKPYWDPVSDTAKNFIRRMLTVDPQQRASIDQLLLDPWLSAAVAAAANAEAKANAPPNESNLASGEAYKLKETEEKLAAQFRALATNTMTVWRAKNQFLKYHERAQKRKAGVAGSAAGAGDAGSAAVPLHDVQIQEDDADLRAGGCRCVLI